MLSALEMRANYSDASAWVNRRMQAGRDAIDGARNFQSRLNMLGMEAASGRRRTANERLMAEVVGEDIPKYLVDLLI